MCVKYAGLLRGEICGYDVEVDSEMVVEMLEGDEGVDP